MSIKAPLSPAGPLTFPSLRLRIQRVVGCTRRLAWKTYPGPRVDALCRWDIAVNYKSSSLRTKRSENLPSDNAIRLTPHLP